MTLQSLLVDILLIAGILAFAITAAGVYFTKDAYDQIHFLSPGSLIGALLIPAAVLVKEGFNQLGAKSIAIALLLVLANPVITHATARAARVRRKQQWQPTPDETFLTPEEPSR